MSGYVKIKASEIPFYISLAQDGVKKYVKLGDECISESLSYDPMGLLETDDLKDINKMLHQYTKIKDMLVKAKDRDIYIDVDSFDLLEEENK